MFVPGLQETILSLGQLGAEGCSTKITKGTMQVFSPAAGEFMFSAFLHAGRYFLDSDHYCSYTVKKMEKEHTMILADATVETWLNGQLVGGLYGVAIGQVFFW